MTSISPRARVDNTNRPFIYRGKQRKYLYEHRCFCCERIFQSTRKCRTYYCPLCLKDQRLIKAANQVKSNLKRAEKLGLQATLTSPQWIATLVDFSWQCAYCQGRPYAVLEHFIPLCLGGGTIIDNVLPACGSCNGIKRYHHPVNSMDEDIFNRLTAYLYGARVQRRMHNA